MQTVQFEIIGSIEDLRESAYHQQLGRKLCSAHVSQQQGIKLDTAFKKIEDAPPGDLWLLMAEIVRQHSMGGTSGAKHSILSSAETGAIQ